MTVPFLSELTRLPEREALQRYFDGENWLVLRWLLVIATPGSLIAAILTATAARWEVCALWSLGFLVGLGFVFGRRRRVVVSLARPLLIAFLALHVLAVAFTTTANDPEPAYVFAGYIIPAALLLFRMRWQEHLGLGVLFLGIAAWFATRPAMPADGGSRFGLFFGMAVWALIVIALAMRLTRRKAAQFLDEWRHELAREREEDRMRGELMDAREIQLSMLPRSTPELSWLDAAGMSIPASEVGGDYYEYFQLDGDRLAMVIGDVAGHGVASGLVLSGVRSGLHLLRDDLTRPVEVLERLNRMVRETAPQRMFVTAQVALIDRRSASVTLANAGHPPLLYLSAGGDEVRELGTSGLPLGTRLDPDYRAVTVELGRGDTLLLYTDGVLEARNLAGAEFGDKRLMEEVRRAANGGSARQVRDSILSAVSRFKGDATQVDDLTLVVLKAGDLGPASH